VGIRKAPGIVKGRKRKRRDYLQLSTGLSNFKKYLILGQIFPDLMAKKEGEKESNRRKFQSERGKGHQGKKRGSQLVQTK